MAAFAITGIQRSRLKHYRPTYYSDLPPIYEDPTTLLRNGSRGTGEYVHCPRHSNDVTGRRNVSYMSQHDYEDINTAAMDACLQTGAKSYSSLSTTDVLNGIMKNSQRYNPNPSRNKCGGYIRQNNRVIPTGSMLNGIMHNRVKSSSIRSTNRVTFCETVNNNYDNNNEHNIAISQSNPSTQRANVEEIDEIDQIKNGILRERSNVLSASNNDNSYLRGRVPQDTYSEHDEVSQTALPVLEDLDKALDMYDGDLKAKFTQPTRKERNSLSSLYQVNSVYTGSSSGYGVVTDEQGFAKNRWPKLDPEPPKERYLLCPAERKMRRRCFAVGFVILVLLIVFLLTGIIEGWMYGKTGTGFGGTEKTILSTFRKDIRNSTMEEETI